MDTYTREDLMFYITVEAIQEDATRRIGRELTECELHSVRNGLEWGLCFDLCTVINTAIDQAQSICNKKKRIN